MKESLRAQALRRDLACCYSLHAYAPRAFGYLQLAGTDYTLPIDRDARKAVDPRVQDFLRAEP